MPSMRSYPPNPGDHLPNTWDKKKKHEIKCKITLSLYEQETKNWLSYTRWFTNWRDIQAWNKTSNLTNLIFDNKIFFLGHKCCEPIGHCPSTTKQNCINWIKETLRTSHFGKQSFKVFSLAIFDKWGEPI